MTRRTARKSPRSRLDAELVRRGLARSREQAADLIAAGRVTVSGEAAAKPATQVTRDAPITVTERRRATPGTCPAAATSWPARSTAFPDLTVAGRHGLDAGASTGGFTDVLLRAGAAHVTAADVGYGQLAWSLRTDPRVTVLDRVNVRSLQPEQAAGPDGRPPDLVVADLSFISLALVLPALAGAARRERGFCPAGQATVRGGQGPGRRGRRCARCWIAGRSGQRRRRGRGRAGSWRARGDGQPAAGTGRKRGVLRLAAARRAAAGRRGPAAGHRRRPPMRRR